eukprot:6667228-Pyramimonas_sp.AAC.1
MHTVGSEWDLVRSGKFGGVFYSPVPARSANPTSYFFTLARCISAQCRGRALRASLVEVKERIVAHSATAALHEKP